MATDDLIGINSLLLADGVTITDMAAAVGMSRHHIYKWVQRFVQQGLEGLQDKPGRGHRPDRSDQHDVDVVF
jgi:transposase